MDAGTLNLEDQTGLSTPQLTEQDRLLAETMQRDEPRLRRFIRRRVMDAAEAEDILQDVFYELVSAYRMLKPAEQMTAWLFRVARNRITDLFRRAKPGSLQEPVGEEEGATLEDLLPSPDAGPEAAYARGVLMEAIEEALEELPEEQREAFWGHEVMGYTFEEMSERTGVKVNTLLSRKRYAVLALREKLAVLKEELAK